MRQSDARADRPDLTLFQIAVWILAALSMPDIPENALRLSDLALFVATWVGVLGATSFGYLSSGGINVTLLPCFQCFLVMTGFGRAVEVAYVLASFLGTLSFSGRIGRNLRESLVTSTRACLMSWATLRASRFAFAMLVPRDALDGMPALAAASIVALLLLQLFSTLFRAVGAGGRLFAPSVHPFRILHGTALPASFMPLLLPALEEAFRFGDPGKDPSWLLPMGFATILAAQVATTISLERSRWSRGRALPLEKAMARLSRKLAVAEAPAAALQGLAVEINEAIAPRALRVSWNGLSFLQPAGVPLPSWKSLRRKGRGGLLAEIWADSSTVLDPSRLDSFVSQTEAALQSIELGSSISREAWSCMEAMVQSLDRSDHRLAGHSKRVARLALETGRLMNLQAGLLDSLRMSALLHHVAPGVLSSRPYEDLPDGDSSLSRFALPQEAVDGLTRVRENFDGTGVPDGLSGTGIPIQARILAVADEFVTEAEREDEESALRAVRLRAGSLYDPAIVQVLQKLMEEGFET
jgi:hypothetical protein